ncbi:hypothetical protein IEE94_01665 [Yimella sp. cx-573]|nr:hypothetical protein [Yimella sp. cx-573]
MRLRSLVVVTSLLLTGCASTSNVSTSTSTPAATTSSTSTTPTPSTSVSVGSTADRSKTFAVVLPQGWKATSPGPPGAVLAITSEQPTDDVFTAFSVVSTKSVKGQSTDDLAAAGAVQMRQVGAKVAPVADRMIGGQPASGYRAERTVKDKKVAQTQFYVQHGDQVFVTTTTSALGARAAADGVVNSILGTWAWTK